MPNKEYMRTYRLANKDKLQERMKLWRRDKKLKLAGRDAVRCDACGCKFSEVLKSAASKHWDHDHTTGLFRGWLCANCNKALGLVGENPAILDALAKYLRCTSFTPSRPVIR